MKVRELIRELKDMPPNATVATSAHDNTEDEIQGVITAVDLSESDILIKRFGTIVVLNH